LALAQSSALASIPFLPRPAAIQLATSAVFLVVDPKAIKAFVMCHPSIC